MEKQSANAKIVSKLLLKLLPVQFMLCAVGSVNGIVSSIFASNFVGVEAMTAVGLYSPLNMLITSVTTIIVGGSAILFGKYMGQNRHDRMQNVFSLALALSGIISVFFIVSYGSLALFDLTGFLTHDDSVRPLFNQYMLGNAAGVIPMVFGSSFASFLSIENKTKRTFAASLIYIGANIALNFLFVQVLHLEALGLALASSIGMWVFMAVQAEVFISGRSRLKISFTGSDWSDAGAMIKIGLPCAVGNVYQTVRRFIVNYVLEAYVGSVGISAFAAANNLLGLVWSIPDGMLVVSRMLISVSVGEEDRQTLTDIMRSMFKRYIPLIIAVIVPIMLCAEPLTRIFYHDAAGPVFGYTAWGLRILPLCMPLSIICMHFTCYGQSSGKDLLVHMIAFIDGVVSVSAFTAILTPIVGMNGVYYANVLNGIVSLLILLGYSWFKNRHFPRNMAQLMVIPDDFGAADDDRLDLSVRSIEDVTSVSKRVQSFCLSRGINERSAYIAGLAMEEMAGNIVDHGFVKDKKKHSVDVRVVHKGSEVILRLRDDCVPFDPGERSKMTGSEDPVKNIGIRMIYKMAKEVQYQNIFGLNVLTMRIDG